MINKKLLIILTVLFVLIAGISAVGYFQQIRTSNQGSVKLVITVLNNRISEKEYTFANMTALELLKKDNEVNTTLYSIGPFINCINKVCSNQNNPWLYYVNGVMVNVGAHDYYIRDKDIVEFRYGRLL